MILGHNNNGLATLTCALDWRFFHYGEKFPFSYDKFLKTTLFYKTDFGLKETILFSECNRRDLSIIKKFLDENVFCYKWESM